MTVHSPHPPISTHGLADGCPRCDEHADDPVLGLDRDNLLELWDRMNEAESYFGTYRSRNEGRAARVLIGARIMMQVLEDEGRIARR